MTLPETITDIAARVRAGDCSAEEVVRRSLDRLEEQDSRLGAFLDCTGERALSRARQIDKARARGAEVGPLAGVPLAVKDNICTDFGSTSCGSKMLAGYRSAYNAAVVERLEQAGAIIVGKTNLDEFAMGSSTEHGFRGATRNPWNLQRVAGGSSGGSAAAVAARVVPGALGSDTGGSIRQPSAHCGVVGLKPTYGRVSRYGLVAFASSLDQIGPITTNVRDAALLLGVIAGHDSRDATSVDSLAADYVAGLDRPLKGLRIGVCAGGDDVAEASDAVAQCVAAAVEEMRGAGAEVVPVRLPHSRYAVACYYIIASAEASSNLARFDGVHYGHRTDQPENVADLYARSRGEGFGAEAKRRIMLGTFVLSSGYYDAYYAKALKVRTLIKRDYEQAFSEVDLIAGPVSPTAAFSLGEKTGVPMDMYVTDVHTIAANLGGFCAMSVPCGFDSDGMPVGLQLAGPAFAEGRLLAAAHQYQLRTDYHKMMPDTAGGTACA